jgi:hypothetical protein
MAVDVICAVGGVNKAQRTSEVVISNLGRKELQPALA